MIPAREVTPPAGRDTLHVSFARPDISEAEIGAVLETLRSGWLTTGPRVDEFERQFADYVGAPHAVAVSSCTAALHLSLLAVGVGRGSEVVTTPMTFCATVNAIIHCGATPVFADIDPETMNLDVQTVKRAITSRTRAILPVHFGGRGRPMQPIGETIQPTVSRLIPLPIRGAR